RLIQSVSGHSSLAAINSYIVARSMALVAEPEGDHGDVDTAVEQLHGRGVPQDMRGEVLVVQRLAALGRGGGVFGEQPGDRVGAQWSGSASREHRIGWAAVVFAEPVGERGDGVGGQRGRAVFASLAV